jgi:hypothetical protein
MYEPGLIEIPLHFLIIFRFVALKLVMRLIR